MSREQKNLSNESVELRTKAGEILDYAIKVEKIELIPSKVTVILFPSTKEVYEFDKRNNHDFSNMQKLDIEEFRKKDCSKVDITDDKDSTQTYLCVAVLNSQNPNKINCLRLLVLKKK